MTTIVNCFHCKKKCKKKPSQIKRYKNVFCSKKCHALNMKSGEIIKCKECNNNFYKNKTKIRKHNFCSLKCRNLSYTKPKINPASLKDYRKKAFYFYQKRCFNINCLLKIANISCDESWLEVDHIDGNRKNTDISNLQILCVLCHALKTRKKIHIEKE